MNTYHTNSGRLSRPLSFLFFIILFSLPAYASNSRRTENFNKEWNLTWRNCRVRKQSWMIPDGGPHIAARLEHRRNVSKIILQHRAARTSRWYRMVSQIV